MADCTDRDKALQANLEFVSADDARIAAYATVVGMKPEDIKGRLAGLMRLQSGPTSFQGIHYPCQGTFTIVQSDLDTFCSNNPAHPFCKDIKIEDLTPEQQTELAEEEETAKESAEPAATPEEKAKEEEEEAKDPEKAAKKAEKEAKKAAEEAQWAKDNPEKASEKAVKDADKAAKKAEKDRIKALREQGENPLKSVKTLEERAMECASFTPITTEVDGKEVVIASEGCDMRPSSTEFGSAGTIGKALDNIADEAFAHVGQAFVNLIENNLISVDVLMDALMTIPGSKLASSLIKQVAECPKPPLIAPPLDDIFKTTELDFCGGNGFAAEITLPSFKSLKVGPFNDIPGLLLAAFEDSVDQLIFNLIKMSFEIVLKIVLNASCETLGDIASLAGGSNLKDALRNALCGPSANDEEVAKGIADILNALNALGGVIPSDACMQEFIEQVGNTLTNKEVRGLLRGEPSPSTLAYVSEITQTQTDPCLSHLSKDDIARMFGGLGNVLDSGPLNMFLGDFPTPAPFNPNICLDPHDLKIFNEHRKSILRSKGLTAEEVAYQEAKTQGRDKQALDDLNNLMAGLGELKLPPLISQNPACPEEGLLPQTDPSTSEAVSKAFGDMYGNVNLVFMSELVTRRGLLNMILCDVRGTGFKWHNNFFIRYFGQPNSTDLGYFGAFANANNGPRNKSLIPVINVGEPILAIYPDTVAYYLQKALQGQSINKEGNDMAGGGFLPNFHSEYEPIENNSIFIKEPDLELHFDGYEMIKAEDSPFGKNKLQFYFDILYNNFTLDTQGNPQWGNEYQIGITNMFSDDLYYAGTRFLSTGSKEYIESLYTEPSPLVSFPPIVDATRSGFSASDDGVKSVGLGGNTSQEIQTEPTVELPSLQQSPQATVFRKIVEDIWEPVIGPGPDLRSLGSYVSEELFNYIYTAFLKKFAIKISQNARAFDFGYDASIEPKIVLLEGDGDEDVYEKYGGNKEMPPFYIEPPAYGGWLGIYDALIPEVDACERAPVVDFGDISDQINELNKKYTDDPRLDSNPECAIEPPYSRILESEAAASIEGAIIAMTRVYIVENFIKGMPVFSLFKAKFPQTFDDILFGYIAELMVKDLQEMGGNVFLRPDIKKHTFYYIFLEQVVQNFGRKVALGDIIPTAAEEEALIKINDIVSQYTEPSSPRKKIKKRREFDKYMSATKDYAKLFLRRYVAKEMEVVSESFNEALNPAIQDLSSLFFGSPDWMIGSLTEGGPLDVPTMDISPQRPQGIEDHLTAETGFQDTIDVDTTDLLNLSDYTQQAVFKEGGGYFPFVLEKYIKIEDYEEGEDPPDNLYRADSLQEADITNTAKKPGLRGVVNINDWKTFLDSHNWEGPKGEKISIGNLYKKWSFGLRISFVPPSSQPNRLQILSKIDESEAVAAKSFKLGYDRLIFPLISSEVEFNMEDPISASLMDTYDITCLVNKMLEDPKYQTLFNYCFPLQSLLSLVTIYTIEGFIPSLGQEWEVEESPLTGVNYEEAGGKQGGKDGFQFRKWDKENFQKTKKTLRGIFRANYHIRDINYKDPESDSNESQKSLRVKTKLPKIKINGKSRRMPWWMRKLLRPRPLEACELDEENK